MRFWINNWLGVTVHRLRQCGECERSIAGNLRLQFKQSLNCMALCCVTALSRSARFGLYASLCPLTPTSPYLTEMDGPAHHPPSSWQWQRWTLCCSLTATIKIQFSLTNFAQGLIRIKNIWQLYTVSSKHRITSIFAFGSYNMLW